MDYCTLEKFPGFETDNGDELTDVLASKFKAYPLTNVKNFQTRTHWAELKSSRLSVFSDEGRTRPSTFQLKQIEDYINANWSRPIEVGELAEEFDMSARTIFRLFARERNQTPLDYIKHVRLQNAQQKLQRVDRCASVAGIALECGFSSLGHFAHDYYSRFHELPSHTLKRGRKTG